jgi:uncharacterized protein (TIGR03435 family)
MSARWACAAVVVLFQCYGQQFEVASIKPGDPDDPASSFHNEGNRVLYRGVTVRYLLMTAYELRDAQISGAPAWAGSERYDVTAKAEGNRPHIPQEEIQVMVRGLLRDRFQLASHWKTEAQPGFALLVGRNGHKLTLTAGGARGYRMTNGPARAHVAFTGSPIAALVRQLTQLTGRPVFDRTGLTGEYDMSLEWAPDNAPADSPLPSLYTAVQDQLGLRLEGQKGDVQILVIDSVQRPSEN